MLCFCLSTYISPLIHSHRHFLHQPNHYFLLLCRAIKIRAAVARFSSWYISKAGIMLVVSAIGRPTNRAAISFFSFHVSSFPYHWLKSLLSISSISYLLLFFFCSSTTSSHQSRIVISFSFPVTFAYSFLTSSRPTTFTVPLLAILVS